MNSFWNQNKYPLLLFIIAAGYFFLYRQPTPLLKQSHETFCLFHIVTGLPCPVCGTGRGLICLLHGDYKNAFLFNPLSYLVAGLSLFLFLLIIKDWWQRTNSLDKWMRVRIAFLYQVPFWLLLAANWIWNIQKGM